MSELVKFVNLPVYQVVGIRHKVEGNKVGVELELEGRGVMMPDVATRGWQRKGEASLRGEAIEYITAGAIDLAEAKKITVELFKKFAANNVRIKESVRTSTHVHLNFSDKRVKDVVNFFSLFTMLEELLQYYSGLDRKGSHFCLAAREGEAIINVLAQAVRSNTLHSFAGDRYKYGACNLSSLYKFGTVEIRTMRGASSSEQVNNWLDILNDLYEYSLKITSPVELITDLSHLGAHALLNKIFKPANNLELMRSFPAVENLHYSLMEGARTVQLLAYEVDEAFKAKYEPPVIKKTEKAPKPVPILGRGDNLQLKRRFGGGVSPRIYLPNGMVWNCYGEHGDGPFWTNGERIDDYRNVFWSEALHRFCVYLVNGELYECNWRRHEYIADEGEGRLAENPPAIDGDEDEHDFEAEGDDLEF